MIAEAGEAQHRASLLADLTPQQREAALALVGPVCILAGPGTGKTHTITRRIAYGVQSGAYAPERLLALTFTNRAAGELRARLGALGTPGVQARTFHSAAMRQLGYFWPQVIGDSMPSVVASKSAVVAEAAERNGIRIEPAQVRAIAEEIEWRKVSDLSIQQYDAAVQSGTREAPTGLSPAQATELVLAYETIKDERRQLDFEDILLATAGMIEVEPWVAGRIREQYRFFVVDEYQDISPLQHKLLRLWMGQRRELCVVGDPAQTIYSFAGAQARFLTDFQREFPEAKRIEITGSFRSTPPILAAANTLATNIPYALQLTNHESTAAKLPRPRYIEFASETEEANHIAKQISTAIGQGKEPSEIAVLVRTNAQTAVLEQALRREGVPVRTAGGPAFFQRPEVRQVIAGLRGAVVAGQDQRPLFQAVSEVLRARGWTQQAPTQQGPLLEAWAAMDAIMRLADAEPEGTTLAQFSRSLQERAANQHEPAIAAVTIATMHAAKGLEWNRVYVAGLSESKVPIAQASTAEQIGEERRLLYVAVTRARTQLNLSSAREHGRPSRFLQEFGNRIRVETPPAAPNEQPE